MQLANNLELDTSEVVWPFVSYYILKIFCKAVLLRNMSLGHVCSKCIRLLFHRHKEKKNTSGTIGIVSEFSTQHLYSLCQKLSVVLREKQMNFQPFVVRSKECITDEMKCFTQPK